ncbi:O-antigen ligase family protein [Photobacterium leiognathi]|uniref:O-antigen ligase family protein n=1 Tax=Photobacterium leiognathi TaxID=553611 RepID=UPI00298207EE|nr:O-antigen ligase family protein [Photobacterium leiognathi]
MKEKIKNNVYILPYIWLFTGVLTYKNGNKALVAFTLVTLIFALLNKNTINVIKKNISEPFVLSLLIITTYAVIAKLTFDYNSNELRALICGIIITLITEQKKITQNIISLLLLLGTISTSFYVFYFSIHLDMARNLLPINAIPYSVICSALLISNILHINRNKYGKFLSFLLIILNASCLIVLETRGVWLATILAVVFIIPFFLKDTTIPKKKLSIIFIIFSLSFLSLSYSDINSRYKQTINELTTISNGNENTSIGLRLQMWKLTPSLISNNYFFGLGENQKIKFKHLCKEGIASPALCNFNPNQYHNQYIDNIIKGGIFGSLVFLIFQFSILFNHRKERNYKILCYSMLIIYTISSLTESVFIHAQTMLLFIIIIYGFKKI